MPEVGIRELRDHLSRYLNEVRDGAELTITDHGKAVARLLPLGRPRKLDQLITDGSITPAVDPSRSLPAKRVKARRPVTELAANQSE